MKGWWFVAMGLVVLLVGCRQPVVSWQAIPTGQATGTPVHASATAALTRRLTAVPMRATTATAGSTLSPTSSPMPAVVATETPILSPTPIPQPSPSLSPATQSEAEVIVSINQERANRDLPALAEDERLTLAARAQSEDMAANGALSHTGSDGSSPGDRISRQGYDWVFYAENVGCGYTEASQMVQAWMGSEGHRNNILSTDAQHVGVGLVTTDTKCTPYWTAVFAK